MTFSDSELTDLVKNDDFVYVKLKAKPKIKTKRLAKNLTRNGNKRGYLCKGYCKIEIDKDLIYKL